MATGSFHASPVYKLKSGTALCTLTHRYRQHIRHNAGPCNENVSQTMQQHTDNCHRRS